MFIEPAERAHMLWESITTGDTISDKAAFLRVIEGGLRLAVDSEREACATIAEAGTPEQDWHPTSIMGQHGKRIAALIRARSETS